jgi:echinoid protein
LFLDYPRVNVGPENPLRVELDDSAILECEVDAKPHVTSVKWTRNGRFIDTQFKHTISRITLQDSGSYTCSADNGIGEAGIGELKVDVLHGPIITLPDQREVNEGDSLVVDCQVAANPKPTNIQWHKLGDDKFQQIGSTLRLTGVTAQHNGKYFCSASNFVHATGKAKVIRTGNGSIEINVRHAPGDTFITPGKPIAVDGKKMTMACGASPPGYPLSQYRWWKDSDDTTLGIGSEFTLDSAKMNNAGQYFCQASNELGEAKTASVYLEVYQAPRMVTSLQPSLLKVESDKEFKITCSAEGKPLPKVNWYKDGEKVTDNSSKFYHVVTTEQELLPFGSFSVHSTLKFEGPGRVHGDQLMPLDRGHFTCQFENDVGDTDTTMLLRIEHAPVVVHNYNKVAFDLGEMAVIKCRMQAFPSPKFDWSFGNNILQTDPNNFNTNSTSLGEDIYETALDIFTVTESSYGDYACKATNKMGSKRTNIRLQPKGKPEQPMNIRSVGTHFNYISITWDEGFNGGYSDTKFMIQYSLQGDSIPLYYDCNIRNPCNITKLEQHSQYSIRVKASNQRGESKYSEEVIIATKVDVSKIPAPKNVVFEKSTSKVSFQLAETNLVLVAKIEIENEDGTWRYFDELSMENLEHGSMIVNQPVSNLRIRCCLQSSSTLCGPLAEAIVVDVRPNAATSASLREPWVIGVIVVLIIIGLVGILFIIRCCCCKKDEKNGKNEETSSNRPSVIINGNQPPPYTSFGVENKGVDTLKDTVEDHIKTNNIYGQQNVSYGYHQVNIE